MSNVDLYRAENCSQMLLIVFIATCRTVYNFLSEICKSLFFTKTQTFLIVMAFSV